MKANLLESTGAVYLSGPPLYCFGSNTQASVFNKQSPINPLYTGGSALNNRQTKLVTSWGDGKAFSSPVNQLLLSVAGRDHRKLMEDEHSHYLRH